MSEFEQRVEKVVDHRISEVMRLFNDAGTSGPDLRPLMEVLNKLFDLLKDVKTELNKVEHNQPKQKEEEPQKKKKKKPDIEDFKKLLDMLTDDDPRNLQQWIDWAEQFEPEVKPPTLPDGTPGVLVGDEGLLSWINYFDRPGDLIILRTAGSILKEVITNFSSKNEVKDLRAFSEHLKEVMRNESRDVQSKVDNVQETLETCCSGMSQSMEDLQSSVDQLNPATASNNVLEILQRQKVIQATLDDIRGLL